MWKPTSLAKNFRPKPPQSAALFFERLEPKILLSADALSGLLPAGTMMDDSVLAGLDINDSIDLLNNSFGPDTGNNQQTSSAESNNPGTFNLDTLAAALTDSAANDETTALLSNAVDATTPRQEIIFVDDATPDYQQLLDGLIDNPDTQYRIFILQSEQDGIEQMSSVLSDQQGIDAIHLLSHGNSEGLQLGNTWLSGDNMNSYNQQLQQWSNALDPDADLLIYGCDLASAASGLSMLDSLAELTGADVAASDDLTGAVQLGGDWLLEYTTGGLETSVAINADIQQGWSNVLGSITVTTFNDVVDGDADLTSLANLFLTPGADGFVSVREALIAANTDIGADEINLSAGTYDQSIVGNDNVAYLGDLDITDTLTIKGDSASTTIIDSSLALASIFEIRSTGIQISDLTISNGGSASTQGGGIDVGNGRDVTLTNVVFDNNQGSSGGAIYNQGGTVTLNQVVFSNNSAIDGGAIYNFSGGIVTGTDVEFSSNTATGQGGAIYNNESLSLDRVLFFDNSADEGGAIFNEGIAGNVVNLTNATFSSNSATTDGGAINNIDSTSSVPGVLNILNSTFTGNTSPGIEGIAQSSSIVNIGNSILNDGGSNISGGTINSLGYNIDSDGSAGLAGVGDQVGNPLLDVLANNGGFSHSHALLETSIAINAGNTATAAVSDQRGNVRLGGADVGAYEFIDYRLIWGETGGAGATDSIGIATSLGNHVADMITGLDDPTSIAIDTSGGKVYWVNEGTGSIERANFDGSNREVIVSSLTGSISIDLYLGGGKIYWIDGSNNLSRANLDGTTVELISSSPTLATGIAIDAAGDKVYWLDQGANSINYTSLSGVGNTVLVAGNVTNSADLALDLVNDKIYWTKMSTGMLLRANLDGSGFESAGVGGTPYGLALDPVGNKTYWMDSAAGELYRMDLSNGANRLTLYSGLADPRDIDVFQVMPGAISNVAPTASNLSSIAVYNEDDLNVPITNIVVSDADSGDIITATLTLANTATGALSANDGASYSAVTGIWSITNTVANVNAALANLIFLPATNNDISTTISVNIDDGDEDASGALTGTISLNVTPSNDIPVATGNTVIASEDVPLVIDASDFSFTDTEGNALVSVTLTGLNLNGGTLTHTGGTVNVTNGMTITTAELVDLTYTSASNDSTNSSFIYTVNDAGTGTVSSTMNITVNAVNDVPVATGNTVIVSEDVPLVIAASDFSFSDTEGNALVSVTLTGLNLNGGTLTHTGGTVTVTNGMTVTATELADLTFTSASNDSTNSSFSYTVNDASAGTVASTMNITVNAVNDVPVATGNTVIANEDVPLIIGAGSFSFSDTEGDALASVTITGLNLNGGTLTHTGGTVNVTNGMTVTATELADLTFTSALNDATNSSFIYTVNDADAGTVSSTMNITVNAVNDVPVATGNTVVTMEDVPLVIAASDFSFNDTEADALVSVTISGLNLNGGTLTHSGGAVTVTNGMTVTAAELVDLTFTSAMNDATNSSFSYTVNDAGVGTVASTMNITVNAVNDVPVATGNTVVTSEDVPLIIGAGNFSFSDTEGDALASVTITGLNLNGGTLTHTSGTVNVTNGMTVTAAELVDLTFTSALNDATNSSFIYTVNDADAGTVSSTMNITVNAVNDVPVATGNTVVTTEDVPLVIAASDFSFSDDEGNALVSVTISGLNLNGGTLTHSGGTVTVTNGMTVTATELADLTFTSALNDATNSSFTYTVNDAGAGTVSSTMNITVNAVNDAPVATGNTVIANEDVPLIIDAGDFNFTDGESDSLASVTITGLNLNGGTLTHSAGAVTVTNGMTVTAAELVDLTFTSASNDSTNSSFTYTVNDAGTGTVSSTMNITVNAANDLTTATNLSSTVYYVSEGQEVALTDIVISDIDTGEMITASLTLTDINNGQLSANNGATYNQVSGVWTITDTVDKVNTALKAITFTPADADVGDSVVMIEINDTNGGGVSPLTGSITIIAEPPVATVLAAELFDLSSGIDTDTSTEKDSNTLTETRTLDTDSEADDLKADNIDVLDNGELELISGIIGTTGGAPRTVSFDVTLELQVPELTNAFTQTENVSHTKDIDSKGPQNLSIERLRAQTIAFQDPLAFIQTDGNFIMQLDDMRQEMLLQDQTAEKLIGGSFTASAGFSVGYVVWLVRSGVIMSSVLSSLPAWRFIDPLPVLGALKYGEDDSEQDDETLESIVGEKQENEH